MQHIANVKCRITQQRRLCSVFYETESADLQWLRKRLKSYIDRSSRGQRLKCRGQMSNQDQLKVKEKPDCKFDKKFENSFKLQRQQFKFYEYDK